MGFQIFKLKDTYINKGNIHEGTIEDIIAVFPICNCFSFSEKPSAPKEIQVTSTDKGSISVAWQPPENDGGSPITGYILETCRSTSSTWMEAGKLDGSTLSHDITGLVESAQYYVRVFAENQAGISKRGTDLDEPVFARKPFSK